jgi:hypothetical protein
MSKSKLKIWNIVKTERWEFYIWTDIKGKIALIPKNYIKLYY